MNPIIELFFRDTIYFAFLAIFLASIGIQIVINLLFSKKPFGSRLASEKFFALVDKQFELKLINNKSDIIALAESFSREKSEKYSFAPLLEDYLKYLVKTSDNRKNEEKTKSKYQVIKNMLDAENEEKPFADIPDEERRLLQSLKNSAEGHNKETINENLEDLRLLISTHNKAYLRNKRINWWSVPLAIFGLIATIIFGFMSIRNTVDYDKIEQVIKNTLTIQGTRQ